MNSPYHPKSTGLIERFIGTLKSRLAATSESFSCEWDQAVSYVVMGYNASKHTTIRHSAYEIIYGRKSFLNSSKNVTSSSRNITEYLNDIRNRIQKIRNDAIRSTEESQRRTKENYDKGSSVDLIASFLIF